MKIAPTLALAFLALLALASSLYASDELTSTANNDSLARAKVLVQQCIGCHGEFGIAPITSNPNLAGQNAEYIEYALKAYRSGERKGGLAFIMRANANGLSDQDIHDLARYFSVQPGANASKH